MKENLEQLRHQMGQKKPGKVYSRQPDPHFCSLCGNAIVEIGFPAPVGFVEVGHEKSCKNYQRKVQ